MRFILIWLFAVQALLNTNANDNDSHSRAPTPRFAFFHKIGAGAPVISQYDFDHVTWKRVTASLSKVIVYFEQSWKSFLIQRRPAPVRKWPFFLLRCLRRLYSAKATMSSLFCDFEQLRATIFELLIKAPKIVWKWRRLYSTWAILSSDISNLGKFVLEKPSLSGCSQIVVDSGK